MKTFLARHADKIIGVLSGLDRVLFRGSLLRLCYASGFAGYLSFQHVLLKEFKKYAQTTSETIKRASLKVGEDLKRPVEYIRSGGESKEERVLGILKKDPVEKGLICVLTCVEPCQTFELNRSREQKKLILNRAMRKCLHVYHYFLDEEFGLMHARLQTWFPFTIQVCLNGRRWLAHQMDRIGLKYHQRDNCFVWVEDPLEAQKLLDAQLRTPWKQVLEKIARRVNPAHAEVFAGVNVPRYWSIREAEWATDVMFKSPSILAPLYRGLVQHAITQFSSPDVMRFLGRKLVGQFQGEIVSDYKHRLEGIRVKHRVQSNSIKIYDKQGSVLRVETTINDTRDLKIFRPNKGPKGNGGSWQPLRKGVSNMHRLAQVSQKSNERYLDALSGVSTGTKVGEALDRYCEPKIIEGKRYRALRWDREDTRLLQAVSRGEFVITGFRNRDICAILYPTAPASPEEDRRRHARVTRLFRLLRGHEILRKIPKTHRYQVTTKARMQIAGILAAREALLSSFIDAA